MYINFVWRCYIPIFFPSYLSLFSYRTLINSDDTDLKNRLIHTEEHSIIFNSTFITIGSDQDILNWKLLECCIYFYCRGVEIAYISAWVRYSAWNVKRTLKMLLNISQQHIERCVVLRSEFLSSQTSYENDIGGANKSPCHSKTQQNGTNQNGFPKIDTFVFRPKRFFAPQTICSYQPPLTY